MTQTDRILQLRQMLAESPKDTFLRYALALEHLKMNQLQESLELFRDLEHNDPDYLATYYQMGKLLEVMNQPVEAERVYQSGMEVARRQKNRQTCRSPKGIPVEAQASSPSPIITPIPGATRTYISSMAWVASTGSVPGQICGRISG